MAIPKGTAANFKTMLRAADNGRLCLLECQDKKTKKLVFAVCAMGADPEKPDGVIWSPLAKMFDGNPYEELNPPKPEGGFEEA